MSCLVMFVDTIIKFSLYLQVNDKSLRPRRSFNSHNSVFTQADTHFAKPQIRNLLKTISFSHDLRAFEFLDLVLTVET